MSCDPRPSSYNIYVIIAIIKMHLPKAGLNLAFAKGRVKLGRGSAGLYIYIYAHTHIYIYIYTMHMD